MHLAEMAPLTFRPTKTTTTNTDDMDHPTIQPKFLSKAEELGLVAVGFSGGQVRILTSCNLESD